MILFKKLLWKYRKWKIAKHMRYFRYRTGLCAAIRETISDDEQDKFFNWKWDIKKDRDLWLFPTNKQNFQKRMDYLDEYIEWRVSND